MSLKVMPELGKYRHKKDLYTANVIIGENGGNDEWPVKSRIYKQPHEKTWSWQFKSGRLLTPKDGVAYEPSEGSGSGCRTATIAHQELAAELARVFA